MEPMFNVKIRDLRLIEGFNRLRNIICQLGAWSLVMP
jgi:hypothetical protein